MKKISKTIYSLLNIFCFYFFITSITHASSTQNDSPVVSSFLSEIEEYSYPYLPESKEAHLLRWDFSGNKIYSYNYSQKVLITTADDDMFGGESNSSTTQSMEGIGILSFKSEKDHMARFVLEDVIMSVNLPSTEGNEPKEMKSQHPPVVVQGVKEDGSMQIGDSSIELLIKLLFPLPNKALKVGEEITTPSHMPFNAMGSRLHVAGTVATKITDFVEINGKKCVKLETIIDISKLDVPEELEGDYTCQVKGKSVFFFNLEDRHFMEGKLALMMSMSVEAPTPQMTISEKTEGMEMPKKINMAMESDNFISVSFIDN